MTASAEDAEGRSRFLGEMDRQLAGWQDPVARLLQALERDEFELYLQPIASLADMGFAMAEVLVRMREEEALMLPPGDFLPVFEEHGMMPALDRWVIERVAMRLSRRPPGGFRRLNVNVSGQTLADAEAPGFIARALSGLGVEGEALCFEIDEADVLSGLEAAATFAARVRRLGCKVAIDGFGRRAATFSPLKTLYVDYIKVDGTITRNLVRSEIAARRMEAIVRVGETIGFGVIAEFVEDQDVLARLRGLRVGYAQGFGIARPAPMGDL
jgi:EAL domain-containing protein (putative c-di-GMP-specific phosphodiesterase class I)